VTVIPPAPDGYDDWLGILKGKTKEGEKALKQVWSNSPAEYRAHLTKYYKVDWDALKAQATAVAVPA
jgi:hypothetical protein